MTIRGLDNYIAGGHYHEWPLTFTCANGHTTQGFGWSEYGTGGYTPEECPDCGQLFDHTHAKETDNASD